MICCIFLNFPLGKKKTKNLPQLIWGIFWGALCSSPFLIPPSSLGPCLAPQEWHLVCVCACDHSHFILFYGSCVPGGLWENPPVLDSPLPSNWGSGTSNQKPPPSDTPVLLALSPGLEGDLGHPWPGPQEQERTPLNSLCDICTPGKEILNKFLVLGQK